MNETIPAVPVVRSFPRRLRTIGVAVSIAVATALPAATGIGAPGTLDTGAAIASFQNVDYIGTESGAALDLGFPVLVPSWVPAPFGGEPSIDAGGGYYSLYWMNSGGDPTFLQVTGEVGGGLPAGSPYDLNVELFINASVQGYDAIHDVTPAYDAVWWIAGGVLYKVESLNSGTDSLSLANSLITFVPPAAEEPEPEPDPTLPPVEEPEPTSPPVVDEPEPEVPDDGETGVDEGDGESSQPVEDEPVEDTEAVSDEPASSDVPETTDAGEESTLTEEGSDGADEASNLPETPVVFSDGTGGPFVTSDGTGGAPIRVIGSDGTGGTNDVVVFAPPSNNQPVP